MKKNMITALAALVVAGLILTAGWTMWLFSQRKTFPPAERSAKLENTLIELAMKIEAEDATDQSIETKKEAQGESHK